MLSSKEIQQLILENQEELAQKIVAKHYFNNPGLVERYGQKGQEHCLKDANYHLTYLAESMGVERPALFGHYVAWAKVLLTGLKIPVEDLADNLRNVYEVLADEFPGSSELQKYIEAGLEQLQEQPSHLPTFIQPAHPHAQLAERYLNHLLQGQRQLASQLILKAVREGIPVKEIYLEVFQRTQYEIGRLWQLNRITVAQEHYCTAATQLIMSQLYSYIFTTEKRGYVLVATCVGEELHEIGMRMVSDFFEMEGWDTYYLGANMPTSSILAELRERQATLLAVSATMTFHLQATADLIKAVRLDPKLSQVKILVGGYCFNLEPKLWQQVGADGYAPNAQQAIEIANQLIN